VRVFGQHLLPSELFVGFKAQGLAVGIWVGLHGSGVMVEGDVGEEVYEFALFPNLFVGEGGEGELV
jgi:hypothetical protein